MVAGGQSTDEQPSLPNSATLKRSYNIIPLIISLPGHPSSLQHPQLDEVFFFLFPIGDAALGVSFSFSNATLSQVVYVLVETGNSWEEAMER